MTKKTNTRTKMNTRRFASIGLWLAGAALLVGIIVIAVKLITYMGMYAPTTETSQVIKYIGLGAIALLILGLAFFALLDPQRVRNILTGRQARYGSSALITLVAVIGIVFVVNLLLYQNPQDWDWTQDKSHTLAQETIDTLKALPSSVEAIGFFTANSSTETANSLLTDYKNNSDGKFDFRFIDPNSNPTLASQYNITRDGTIVLVMNDQQEMVTYPSESELTNALVRIMNPGQRAVYFLTGHGEADIQNAGETSFTRVRTLLEAKNYTVSTLNLRAENSIPSDALAIIIPGKTNPISDAEVTLIWDYLTQGGSLVLLEDPTVLTNMGNEEDSLQTYLVDEWGVEINNDIVIDPTSNPLTVAISYSYGTHAITNNLSKNLLTFFPIARSIGSGAFPSEVTLSPLVLTIDTAWGETNFDSLSDGTYANESNDTPGPITLGVAAENTSTRTRLVVFGNSSFASDTYIDQYGNADLVINSIDWAAEQDNMINLTAKTPTDRTLLPLSTFAWLMLGLAFICIIPGLVIAGGVASWLIRRSKG